MKRYKLSKKRKNDSVIFLKRILKSKSISKEEKQSIKRLIIGKQKKNKILSDKTVHSKIAELAYILLRNFRAGETTKIGNIELTTYDAKEVLQVMSHIVNTANNKNINLK